MLERVHAFKEFVVGHQDCFCCDDCDQEEDCLTLYNAQKLIEQLDLYTKEPYKEIPEALLQEMEVIFDRLQECAWQHCDCRTRY